MFFVTRKIAISQNIAQGFFLFTGFGKLIYTYRSRSVQICVLLILDFDKILPLRITLEHIGFVCHHFFKEIQITSRLLRIFWEIQIRSTPYDVKHKEDEGQKTKQTKNLNFSEFHNCTVIFYNNAESAMTFIYMTFRLINKQFVLYGTGWSKVQIVF